MARHDAQEHDDDLGVQVYNEQKDATGRLRTDKIGHDYRWHADEGRPHV